MKCFRQILALILCLAAVACSSCAKKDTDNGGEGGETTTGADTTAEPLEAEPEFINPLTGLAASRDVSGTRPVSIMINNIHVSLPQEGIAQADIMYECLAEGGITRLMMLSTEYDKLTQVGSVRSARDYYIDYAESYNCIFIHAGGSDYAYDTIYSRGIDHLDGVKGSSDLYYVTNTFVRDPERLKNYSSEHTLMVKSGEGIVAGINYAGISTEKAAGYEKPVNFVPWGESVTLSGAADHVKVVMSSYQTVDFVYSESDGGYLRFQYGGEKHMDSAAGKQLCFKNVILLITETGAIPNDDKARIWVTTTGEGSGWYVTDGKCQKIKWKKEDHSSPIKYFYEDGTEVALNRGKTMINVVPAYSADEITFDSDKSLLN